MLNVDRLLNVCQQIFFLFLQINNSYFIWTVILQSILLNLLSSVYK